MTNTERKLDEADYFLRQLKPNDPYFDYILSAYLNAARSTTWVMRHEFCKVKDWEEWFASCKISHEQTVLLKRINQLRIVSTKQDGIKTPFYFPDGVLVEEEYYPIIKEILNHPDGTKFKMTMSPVEENDSESTEEDSETFIIRGRVQLNPDESEMSREAILDLCNQYFEFLKKYVKICIEKFSFSLNRPLTDET
ncbi:MAG: hypothetical protein JW947_05640 [Sedimentisphaerales bacterium]|nr:hypothetical protein [Sedimentisphaerales bacterium]